ncbi:hypothetical protein [Caproiciproducens galactitolivorans]|nr:hypothetical protein [Caproiciproducens galactitolivorans]
MKLSKEQKDIISHIQSGEITDVYSFVKYYGFGTYVGHNRSAIEEAFHKQYGDKKYKCRNDDSNNNECIIEEIDEKYVWAKPTLSYFNSEGQVIKHHDIVHGFSLFEPTYICENINAVISFIALWQYLKSEGLIIELPKSCSEKDVGLFLRKEPIPHNNRDIFEEGQLRLSDMSVNVAYFLDWKYALDEPAFEVCLPYLNMKLYPAPALLTYITKGHKTLEEIRERRNMRIALAGVLIALITSIASIIISFQDKGYHNELQEIHNSLQEIHADLFGQANQDTEKTSIDVSSKTIK